MEHACRCCLKAQDQGRRHTADHTTLGPGVEGWEQARIIPPGSWRKRSKSPRDTDKMVRMPVRGETLTQRKAMLLLEQA